MQPHGMMFHHFHKESTPYIKQQGSINADDFADIIEFYQRNHEILSASDWYNGYINNTLKSNQVCLTFDDNLKCQYHIAYPVLKAYNLTGFFFIFTSPLRGEIEKIELFRHFRMTMFTDIDSFYNAFYDFLKSDSKLSDKSIRAMNSFSELDYLKKFSFYTYNDRLFRYLRDQVLYIDEYDNVMNNMIKSSSYDIKENAKYFWMNQDEIKTLHNEGNIIGLHSDTHPTNLANFEYSNQLAEYKQNYEVLKNIIGDDIKTLSHPCNSYNQDTLDILDNLGIELAFRSNMHEQFNHKYEIPRADHADILRLIRR